MAESIEQIRTDLADIRDRLEAVAAETEGRREAVALAIIEAAAGALTTALVALDHPDARDPEPVPVPSVTVEPAPVVDLMAALERSIGEARADFKQRQRPGTTEPDAAQ